MKRFMAMLNRNKNKDPPPAKLLDLAGQLCQDLQSSSSNLEKLVGAMMGCKHKMSFLTNIHVVRACVFIHIRNGQHDTACRLLECCKAEEKEELVQLWHEVHYRRAMEKHRTDFLTPLQKFRCRKRNPPPISLCPEGLKNRNYSDEVRQQLHRFAAEVTTNPNKKQREGLARDMNLQPIQVYNWFANYRRRQKSCLPRAEKLNNSCPERPLTYHTKERQDEESYTPQTADGSCVGIGSEQIEMTLVPCDPGWEQPAADLHKPPEGTYLKMMESSFMQSSEMYEARTSEAALTTHSAEQPVAFCTEAMLEPGTCFNSAVLQPREGASSTNASPHLDNFFLCSCGSLTFPDECLAAWQAPCSSRGDPGSMWTPSIEAGIRASLSRVPQGGCTEASSGGIIQQSDLEVESFILRERQLGTRETILPHSSCQTVFGKPQCPLVSVPYVEESQAWGQRQVRTHLMFRERSLALYMLSSCSSHTGDAKPHIIFRMKRV
ncbi:LOW QUALITY PROTEIN: anomalous homeobox protein [Falco cherrug]|uniref:LOW QUALITY PROTEIN: anomalous homeobox protein n=1 Tax=Falco cherrug TaxID=345164 RepID=UPI0024794E70|nr:LOW QUALITY PROTEIN: anomalous homeobox protein [Falco cherrug]